MLYVHSLKKKKRWCTWI